MALGPMEGRAIRSSNIVTDIKMNYSTASHDRESVRQSPKSVVTRSQSIKIPRRQDNEWGHHATRDESVLDVGASVQDISQLQEHHRAATMQMYHRIMDYRARTSFYSLMDDTTATSATNTQNENIIPTFRSLPNTIAIQDNFYPDYNQEDSATDHEEYISEQDGAIFDLDW